MTAYTAQEKREALELAIDSIENEYMDIRIWTDESGITHTASTEVHDEDALESIAILESMKKELKDG